MIFIIALQKISQRVMCDTPYTYYKICKNCKATGNLLTIDYFTLEIRYDLRKTAKRLNSYS